MVIGHMDVIPGEQEVAKEKAVYSQGISLDSSMVGAWVMGNRTANDVTRHIGW